MVGVLVASVRLECRREFCVTSTLYNGLVKATHIVKSEIINIGKGHQGKNTTAL